MASDVGDSNDGIPVFLEYILHVLVAANSIVGQSRRRRTLVRCRWASRVPVAM